MIALSFMLRGVISGMCITFLLASYAASDICNDNLAIRTQNGRYFHFDVTLAETEAQRARGLMDVTQMQEDVGMLFLYNREGQRHFWMKRTYISLDLLFADKTGLITKIHHSAQPLDETPIFGGDFVQFVLEINGGLSKRLGITEGSQLIHPQIFTPTKREGQNHKRPKSACR